MKIPFSFFLTIHIAGKSHFAHCKTEIMGNKDNTKFDLFQEQNSTINSPNINVSKCN